MKRSWMFVAATVFSSPIFAQDSSRVLDPLVVTANKTEQKQSTTGKVITVISKEQIGKSAGKTLTQLLNEQAGITINGALNAMGTPQTVFTRGSATGRTLILLDGIPVTDPSEINNNFDLNLLSLSSVESIEIARGAQSTLYGSDAVAGVINIITTKKDIKKPFNLSAGASAGNFNTFRANAQLYGKINKLTYTARYGKSYTDGFSTAYDKAGGNNYDKDGFKGDIADARLTYQITPQLSVKAFAMYSRYKTDVDRSVFADDKDFVSTNKTINTGGGFQFKNDALTLIGNYQYNDISRLLFNDSTDSPGNLGRNNYYGKSQFAEIYANIKLGSGFSILQGGDFRHNTTHQKNFGTYPASVFGPAGSFSSQVDSVASQASLYSSFLYNSIGGRLNVELGGRLNVHSRYGSNYTYTFNPSYSFNDHFRIFGSIATGFKAPSLYQLYASNGGNRNLKAETSTNYEAGIQQRHGIVSNRLVYFYRRIKNGIDYQNNNWPVPSRYFNFNRQIVKGLEFETTLQPCKELVITANYTWTDIDESTQSRVNFKDTTYAYSLRRPKHNLNVAVGYNILPSLLISVNGKYVSGRNDVGGYQVADIMLGDYFIFGAYSEFKFKEHYKIFVNAMNLGDRKFFDLSGYNSIPFTINGGIVVNF